jgi:hypothetical protein
MRKSLSTVAALVALGVVGIAAPTSAAPGIIGGVDASTGIVEVRMDDTQAERGRHGMRRHVMRHNRHHRGHMMRHGHGHRHHRM